MSLSVNLKYGSENITSLDLTKKEVILTTQNNYCNQDINVKLNVDEYDGSYINYDTVFYFEALESNSTVRLKANTWTSMETSTDNINWSTYTANTTITLPNVGDKLFWRGTNLTISSFYSYYGASCFFTTGQLAVAGNINRLLSYTEDITDLTGRNLCFTGLFMGCTSLRSIKNLKLPATTLTTSCYNYLFANCSNIVDPVKLPATTLAEYCYAGMFTNCSNLTNTPELPATTLANDCYYRMFDGCTSLTALPVLPATTLANYCYGGMFRGCIGLTSISANLLPVQTLVDYCYIGMFKNCTGLTTIPINLLPATTLASLCYWEMFYGCTSLTTPPALPATTLVDNCYRYMFLDCTHLVSVPALPATSLSSNYYGQMFYGCTSLYVSDTSIAGTCDKAWVIPTNAVASGDCLMGYMFTSCLGTRLGGNSPNFNGVQKTYYTQNTPVS